MWFLIFFLFLIYYQFHSDDVDQLESLIRRGKSVNTTGSDYWSPLHYSVARSKIFYLLHTVEPRFIRIPPSGNNLCYSFANQLVLRHIFASIFAIDFLSSAKTQNSIAAESRKKFNHFVSFCHEEIPNIAVKF